MTPPPTRCTSQRIMKESGPRAKRPRCQEGSTGVATEGSKRKLPTPFKTSIPDFQRTSSLFRGVFALRLQTAWVWFNPGFLIPTFLIFSSVENYADFDETTAAHQATLKALTKEEQAARLKFQTEGVISSEMNRFKLDPTQSYVSKETRAQDPAFWSAK